MDELEETECNAMNHAPLLYCEFRGNLIPTEREGKSDYCSDECRLLAESEYLRSDE